MRTVSSIVALPNEIMAQPVTLSVTTSTATLLGYKRAWVALDIDDVGTRWVNLDTLRSQLSGYTGVIQGWFDANPDAPLALSATPPFQTKVSYASARDAFMAGFGVTPVHPLYGENATSSMKTALRLRREDSTSYSLLNQYGLATVNGFLHQISTDNKSQLLVLDGNTSALKAKMNHVGLISFYGVSTITRIALNGLTMVPSVNTASLYNGATIRAPSTLLGKTVFLSFGGYLLTPEQGVFTVTGERQITLDFKKLDLAALYFEAKNYIDMTTLPCAQNASDNVVTKEQLHSDDNLLAWLRLSQSFLIVADNPNIFMTRQYVRNAGNCSTFIAHKAVSLPLQIGLGRLAEYLVRYEDKQWHLDVSAKQIDRLLYQTSVLQDVNIINSSSAPANPVRELGACLLEIATGYPT